MCFLGDDNRFSIVRNSSTLGVLHNFEKALSIAPEDTDYICCCDQDDIWMPEKLEYILKEFDDPEVMLCHTDLQLIDEKGHVFNNSCFEYEQRNINDYRLRALLLRNSVTGCALAFRSNLIPFILPFPHGGTPLGYYHDVWIALHAVMHGRISTIMQPLIKYRQHGQNTIGSSPFRKHSWIRCLRRTLFRKESQRHVYKWRIFQRLINDFLISIKGLPLTLQQENEVKILKKWCCLHSLSFSLFFFAIERAIKRDPYYPSYILTLLGKWLFMFQASKSS